MSRLSPGGSAGGSDCARGLCRCGTAPRCRTYRFPKDEDADIRAKFDTASERVLPLSSRATPHWRVLPRIEKFVRDYDICLAIHNHGPEDRLWHSPLDVLSGPSKHAICIGCCIDVGHTVRAGTDVVQAIREAGPRLFNVHMKDLANFQ